MGKLEIYKILKTSNSYYEDLYENDNKTYSIITNRRMLIADIKSKNDLNIKSTNNKKIKKILDNVFSILGKTNKCLQCNGAWPIVNKEIAIKVDKGFLYYSYEYIRRCYEYMNKDAKLFIDNNKNPNLVLVNKNTVCLIAPILHSNDCALPERYLQLN